jgi:hypothetical protein
MKKLTLRLNSLAVESFRTGGDVQAPGTVEGHFAVTCAADSCTPYPSLHNTRCGCTPAVYQAVAVTQPVYACDPFSAPPRCS